MKFELTLLGTNSALPAHGRYPSAQLLNIQDSYYLIDCGEGTQIRLMEFDQKWGKINQIFISHMHGDHVYGLVGLLTTYSLFGRKSPIDIFGPLGIEELIHTQLRCSYTQLAYPININTVDTLQYRKIFENSIAEVYSIPLIHRVPTTGYLFREKKRQPNVRADKIKAYNLNLNRILTAKEGFDVILPDGTKVPNKELVNPAPPPRAFAYCSDTMYSEAIIPYIKEVDILYHESTFLEERKDRAVYTKHSTAIDAATIAQKAKVKKLVLGHYSSRHRDVKVFEKEAQTVFKNTVAGIEGLTISVPYVGRAK